MRIGIKETDEKEIEGFIKEIWTQEAKERGYLLNEDRFYHLVLDKEKKIGYIHIK